MAAVGLRRRVEALEQANGGECPRCAGLLGVFVCGEFHHASRQGEAMSREEWEQATDEDGACPLCGAEPVRIKAVYDGEA